MPRVLLLGALLSGLSQDALAWNMNRVTSLQARVDSFEPVWDEEHMVWVSGLTGNLTFEQRYAATLDSVTTSSVEGALMYLQRDCIDTGAAPWTRGCQRVNDVKVITFLEVQIANPNAALAEYQDDRYTYPEFCPFVEMKNGQCIYTNDTSSPTVVVENPPECKQYNGLGGQPHLGPCVGAEAFPTDNIAPYFDTVWFSYPNSCVMNSWAKGKDAECRANSPGGLCPFGVVPDGVKCQFSYKILGFIHIDELVGITAMSAVDTSSGSSSADADDVGADANGRNILANPGEDSVAEDGENELASGSDSSFDEDDDDSDGMVAEDGTKFGTWKCNSDRCFENFEQFCLANNTEFHSTDKDRTLGLSSVQSIEFWGFPSDHRVNKNRTAFMIHEYNRKAKRSANVGNSTMTPLPIDLSTLTKKNPPCYENAHQCYESRYGCKRHSYAQVCTLCREMGADCVIRKPGYEFPDLVQVPRTVSAGQLRSKTIKLPNAKAANGANGSSHLSVTAMAYLLGIVVIGYAML